MKKFVVIFAALPLLFLAPASVVLGNSDDKETKVVTVPVGEVINRDHIAVGDVVEISGTVNGDVYAFAGQVLVDGTVNGDLITAAGAITVSGTVSQDLRAAGGTITINGSIKRNITVGGGVVEITDDARIGGSILGGTGTINIAAPVGGNVKIGSGALTISNKINGDLEAGVEDLRLTSKAAVTGDLTYWSEKDASIDDKAVVSGEVTKKKPPAGFGPKFGPVVSGFSGFRIFSAIVGFISTLIIGLLLIKFFPNFGRSAASNLSSRPWASLGLGFAAFILTPIIGLILLVTLVGIPLALILGALYEAKFSNELAERCMKFGPLCWDFSSITL
jgi:hypothetical protein